MLTPPTFSTLKIAFRVLRCLSCVLPCVLPCSLPCMTPCMTPRNEMQEEGFGAKRRSVPKSRIIGGKIPPLTGKQKSHYRGAKVWHGQKSVPVFVVRRLLFPPDFSKTSSSCASPSQNTSAAAAHHISSAVVMKMKL